MAPFAKILFESPLPQLDRTFDYRVPSHLQDLIKVGQRVIAPFGRGSKPTQGFVAELVEQVDFLGELSEISEIIWTVPVLPAPHAEFLRAVADRQAVSIGDVLKQALPDRAVRLEKTWNSTSEWEPAIGSGKRISHRISPGIQTHDYGEVSLSAPSWVHSAIEIALEAIASESNVMICVPDFRDIQFVKKAFDQLGLLPLVVDYSASQTRTERYGGFLSGLTQSPVIVLGTRSVMYAPITRLSTIILFDEGNSAHFELSSPYICSRDLALLRNKLHKTELHFLGHAPSTAMLRLERIGFFELISQVTKPKVMFSSGGQRLDDMAFAAIRRGLQTGPVLVQVSNLGVAKSAYCARCSTRATCKHCSLGGLWLDELGQLRCRLCAALNLDYGCSTCGTTKTRMGRAGSTRTASEFGRTFPGVPVLEATGDQVQVFIDDKPRIVVSTPDAAPAAPHGYSAIVILDADVALARDTLFAREDAIRTWANTASLLSSNGELVLTGVSSDLGAKFATWQLDNLITDELADRIRHDFPPAVRVLSVFGSNPDVALAVVEFQKISGVQLIGKSSVSSETRAILKFPYRLGEDISSSAKALSLKASAKSKVSNSGRAARALTIKMDDLQVL